jgi:hypothetical protein
LISRARTAATPSALHDGEVDRCPTDDALSREPATDLERLARDLRRISRIGWEVAAEVRLAVRPAENLIVRRHDVHLSRRADP